MNFKEELLKSKKLEAEAIAECNNEPIAFPRKIQGYGALLAFDFNSLKITYASANLSEYLDCVVSDIMNLSVRDFLNPKDFHDIANLASHKSTLLKREFVKTSTLLEREVDISLFRSDNNVVLEFIPLVKSVSNTTVTGHIKWVLDNIRSLNSVDEILTQAVNSLKSITEYDRVKAYKFHPDNSGEVVAEVNNGKMDSFMSLRFPAYDIPEVARALFLKIPLRHIYSTTQVDVDIISAHNLDPLDLSISVLRANSPIHNQYLRNMGVKSTVSIPLIVHGKLWGLCALHNQEDKFLNSDVIFSAELIGQLVGMILEQTIEKNAAKKLKLLQLEGSEFITVNQNSINLKTFWNIQANKLKKLIKCNGLAYQLGEQIMLYGDTPSEIGVQSLTTHFDSFPEKEIFHFNDLSEINITDMGPTKGALVLKIYSKAPKINMYFFRNEVEQEIKWAGNPKKDLTVEKSMVRLHPRSSFNHFKELTKGKCELWSSETLSLAEIALQTFQKAVSTEKATSERLKIIVHELNHRLRNILTLVRSISRQTVKDDVSIDEYVDSLEHRILALAQANSLLTKTSYNPVDLKSLINNVIEAIYNKSHNITINGSEIKLNSEIIPTMVLIIHELTTNAVKYGSLSSLHGKINISWNTDDEDLVISWKESGGPLVKMPHKLGFGTTILSNAIKYEFGGKSEMEFHSDGFYARFKIPLKLTGENEVSSFVAEKIKEVHESSLKPKKSSSTNVLILEDDYINAQDQAQFISTFPVNEVNLFSNQKEALESLKNMKYHLALLDVNLKEDTCLQVAKLCAELNIPFYYLTGYGNDFITEGIFPKAPILLKPVKRIELKKILEHYFNQGEK